MIIMAFGAYVLNNLVFGTSGLTSVYDHPEANGIWGIQVIY